MKNIILLLTASCMLVVGQALWKLAANTLNGLGGGIKEVMLKLPFNTHFLLGSLFYVLATFIWIYILGQFQYSKIYPIFVGICILMSFFVGVIFFHETQGISFKVAGGVLILIGVYFLSRS